MKEYKKMCDMGCWHPCTEEENRFWNSRLGQFYIKHKWSGGMIFLLDPFLGAYEAIKKRLIE